MLLYGSKRARHYYIYMLWPWTIQAQNISLLNGLLSP